MESSLRAEYRRLYLSLSKSEDAPTALLPVGPEVSQLPDLPALQVHAPRVLQVMEDGWAHDDVPRMMRGVMDNVYAVATTVDREHPVWGTAVKAFNDMIKLMSETLKPTKGNGLSINNNIMLESLRDVRI